MDGVENGEYDVGDDARAKSYLDSALVTLCALRKNKVLHWFATPTLQHSALDAVELLKAFGLRLGENAIVKSVENSPIHAAVKQTEAMELMSIE